MIQPHQPDPERMTNPLFTLHMHEIQNSLTVVWGWAQLIDKKQAHGQDDASLARARAGLRSGLRQLNTELANLTSLEPLLD